jgi:hypothetical protein
MKGLSPEGLTRRVVRALEDCRRVWVASDLPELRAELPADRLVSAAADIAVVRAREASATGQVTASHAPPPSSLRWAVLDPVRIVERCQTPVGRVERLFSAMGVLEVGEQGLVIVELAPGVSAIELQAFAEPTLKISSRVDVMRDSLPASEARCADRQGSDTP